MEQLLVAKSDSAPVSQTRCRKFKVQKYYGFAFFIILELFFSSNRSKKNLYLPQEQPKICHETYQIQALWSLHAGLCNTDLYADK